MKKLFYFILLVSAVLCNAKNVEAGNICRTFFGKNQTYHVKSYQNRVTDDEFDFQRGEAILTVNNRNVKLTYAGDVIFSVNLTILASGPVLREDTNISYYKIAEDFYDGILAADDESGEIEICLLFKIDGVYYICTRMTLYS